MAGHYYFLVASLRDYPLDGGEKDFDAGEIRDYVRENLRGEDLDALDLFYTYYDIENIVSVAGRGNRFNGLGNFTIEELDDEVKRPERLPAYLGRVLEAYAAADANEDEEVDLTRRLERSLYEAFYRQTSASPNRFIREWFDFDRTLRNICAAVAARRAGRPAEDVVVGDDPVATALARNTAADFGLKGEVDYIDTVIALVQEEQNVLEKERRLDVLRWVTSEELTTFNYFDMDAVLAYLARINLVYRWRVLDPRSGREMFDHLLGMLSGTELFDWIARKQEETKNWIS